ncbi:ABC transporter permease [Natronococcus pandeyae]|uniref:ABC transporter permease n=1 Tax=Natronococcus pandeyae TaxID=2055836 RepID=A0A8J8Q405_9EURY|nr:FtsX-like permease family protein [Natronococcus pandeyae]TYL36720.1 ABC transporter permease [Natronococcus pandeyae]
MREREPGIDEETPRSRAARLRGLLEVALAVVRAQTVTARGRTIATVCIVALTVANLLLVTGVALALADDEPVAHDAELRVVPDDSGVHGTATGVEGPRLGESHDRAATIAEHDGVTHATPVLTEPVRIEHPETGHDQYLLLVGVVPGPEPTTIAGLSTDTMESGDSQYADGTDDGDPAGEIVLSTEAAETLEADAGDSLEPGSEVEDPGRSYTVVDVDEPADGDTEIPVALVHLSELQSMTGADTAGLADQVLVWGEADAAQTAAADAYPEAELETGGPTDIRTLFGDELALATSVLALIVAFAVCSLLVATTAGLRVESDRRTLATLGAVGFPTGSRLLVVATTTLATAGAGALLGLVLGVGGIAATNAIATATVAPEAVAVVHPLFVPYAIGVAVLSTLVALPYPLALAARTDLLAEVDR